MLQENQILDVEIIDLNHMGKGVAKSDNLVIFVDDVIPGDIAKIKITEIKKNYALGELITIIKPSENRIDSACGFFEQCGGCQLMHMNYEEQLKYKRERVINELKRTGGYPAGSVAKSNQHSMTLPEIIALYEN
jgi:23S rRNA (uracil1939-C5)-methyltransferase